MGIFNRKKSTKLEILTELLGETSPDYLKQLNDSYHSLMCSASEVSKEANNTAAYLKEELANAKHRFFTVIDNMVDIVIIKNNQGQWLTANKYTQELFGITPDVFRLKTSAEIGNICHVNCDMLSASGDQDRHAWEAKDTIRYSHSFIDTHGKERLFDIVKTPVFDDVGHPQEIIIVGRDITRLKHAQQMNRAVTRALNNSSDMITILDKHGKIIFCNNRFLQIFGYADVSLVENKPISIIKSNVHSDTFYKDMWDTVKRNEMWYGNIVNKDKNGDNIDCCVTLMPVMNGQPNPINFICIMKPNPDGPTPPEVGLF